MINIQRKRARQTSQIFKKLGAIREYKPLKKKKKEPINP